jgi:hypothetical protein
MAGRVVLYVVFAFFGVIAFLVTTSDASSRMDECTAEAAIVLGALGDLSARIDAVPPKPEDDPVKGVAALLEVAEAYNRWMGALQNAKVTNVDVKNVRGELAHAIDQLHGWLVAYAQAVQKGELHNLKSYRSSVETARADVADRVARLKKVCAP